MKCPETREAGLLFIYEIVTSLGLLHETLFSAMATLDAYLLKTGSVKHLQAVVLCCLHLANKYEEIYPVSFFRLRKAMNDPIEDSACHQLEITIFSSIGYKLPVYNVFIFF